MNPSGESSSGGFMRTLRRIAAAFGYGGGGISGYRESSGSNGTFARGGTDGQNDFMNNPFAIGTDAYANEQAAQEDISSLRRRQRDEALKNLGVQFIEGTFEEVLVASSNENQQGLDGTAYSPLYNVETIFKANGSSDPNLLQRWLKSFGQILQPMVPTREPLTPLEEDRRLQELVDLNKDAIETNDASVATPLDPNQPLDRGNTNPNLGHIFSFSFLFNSSSSNDLTIPGPVVLPLTESPVSPDTLNTLIQGGINSETLNFVETGRWWELQINDSIYWRHSSQN